jgi:glycosyltransferase involved in cell wall biosynthesis
MANSRPSVLIVGPVPPPYHGPAISTQALLQHPLLNQRFHLVHLDTSDRRSLVNLGRVDWINIWLALKHAAEGVRHLAVNQPAIMLLGISQNTPAMLRDALLLLPAIGARCKLVIELNGSNFRRYYEGTTWPLQILIRYLLRHSARVIVLGDRLRPIFAGLVADERVVTIPNGVDGAPFARLRAQPAPRPANGFQVTYLSNLIETKGYEYVLQAAPLILERVPNVHFTLAGSPVYEDNQSLAYQQAAIDGLGDHVSFPSVVVGDVKCRLLLDSDVFVFPPIAPEGQPLVLLEAMAAGLPIVTTDQGAILETVLDGVNGFIVPARDAVALAEKVILLLQDEALRRRMGQASRERFEAHYTLERWCKDIARVFQDVLAEP